MSNLPVSSRVLEAAIAWKLSLGDSSGTPDERSKFMRWHAASEEHARAWRQLGAMDQRDRLPQIELAVGAEVILANGIYGKVYHIKDDRVTIEIEGSERPGCVVDTISRLYFE